MIFNLWYGQARPSQTVDGKPVKMYHRHVTPKKLIQIPNQGSEPTEYRVDVNGNIEITNPAHIEHIRPLGWPQYIGNGISPILRTDLLFDLDPLDGENRHRPLSETEWDNHLFEVYGIYLKTAREDQLRGTLTEESVRKYCDTIEMMCGHSLDPAVLQPFRDLI